MTPSLLMAVLASGFIYGITPGPGVLAVFGIGAARGRRAGAGFLCGHLLGDVIWCSTALIAIVGAREFGSTTFNVLGLLSGLYLFWLGLRAVRAQRSNAAQQGPARRPFAHGIIFGLTNPKAYPVAVATFTALLSINLGLINLFPIPVLDGGHLVFYALEAIKGSPVPEKAQEYAFRLGFTILIGLMVFANLSDILQLIL